MLLWTRHSSRCWGCHIEQTKPWTSWTVRSSREDSKSKWNKYNTWYVGHCARESEKVGKFMCAHVHIWVHTCACWGWWWDFRQDDQEKPPRAGIGCIKTQGDEWQAVLAHREQHLSGKVIKKTWLQARPASWPRHLEPVHPLSYPWNVPSACLLSQAQAAQGRRLETEPRGTLSISFYHSVGQGRGATGPAAPKTSLLSKLPCLLKGQLPVQSGLPAFCLSLPSVPGASFRVHPGSSKEVSSQKLGSQDAQVQGVGGKEDAGGVGCGEGQKALRAGGGVGTGGPRSAHPNKTLAFLSPPACRYCNLRAEQAWFSSFPPEFAVNCSVHTHPYALHPSSPTFSHQIQSFCWICSFPLWPLPSFRSSLCDWIANFLPGCGLLWRSWLLLWHPVNTRNKWQLSGNLGLLFWRPGGWDSERWHYFPNNDEQAGVRTQIPHLGVRGSSRCWPGLGALGPEQSPHSCLQACLDGAHSPLTPVLVLWGLGGKCGDLRTRFSSFVPVICTFK